MKVFFKQFLGTAMIKYLGKLIVVLSMMLFTRIMSVKDFGTYSYIISIITIASIPVISGLPNLIIRDVSRYIKESRLDKVNGIFVWSTCYIFFCGILSSVVILTTGYFNLFGISSFLLLFIISIVAILNAYLNQQSAFINGFSQPEKSQISINIVLPITLLSLTVGYYQLFRTMNSNVLLVLLLLSTIITLIISTIIFLLVCRTKVKRRFFEFNKWNGAIIPLSIMGIIGTLNTELISIFLGGMVSKEQLAYFKVAMQTVLIIKLALTSINVIVGPKVASLYDPKDIEKTQKVLKNSVRLSCLVSFPFFILLIMFGDIIITTMYGTLYSSATNILYILLVGQVFNIIVGSVHLILNMIGMEKEALKILMATLIITIIMIVIIVPYYGALGAACVSSASLILWNFLMAAIIYKKTRLKPWLH